MEFYSHKNPNKLLRKHLIEVRDLVIRQVNNDLKPACQVACLCHDFGKYTTYFQDHLFKGTKPSDKSNHGFISAVFGAFVSFKEFGEDSILPLIIFNCILHHHGSIESPEKDLPKSFREISPAESQDLLEKLDAARLQLEDMSINEAYIISDYETFGYGKYVEEFLHERPLEDTLKRVKRLEAMSHRGQKDKYNYFLHQIIYSALISADKLSAANIELPDEMYADVEMLEDRRRSMFSGNEKPIYRIREEIYKEVEHSITEKYQKSKIFSITAPTGTGKTYTGFMAAERLCKLLGGNRRIIYALPFTSIIEQNYDSLEDLLSGIDGFEKNEGRFILKHHNLANVDYKSEDEDYSNTQSEMLMEAWNSGIIVTTFVQVLETLVGTRNRMLKKFNSFKGAIILLDEVQAIDIEYHPLVEYILRMACEYLDCRIIMMTATKPFILMEAEELLKDNKRYFEFFNRTKLHIDLNKITVNEFVERAAGLIEDKSCLIVCNTIKQSLKVYEGLKCRKQNVFYLSANLLPVHRRQRIGQIKEMLENQEKPILVSTQVVEAGVDFDFDMVIRDLAPLDSTIQSAGRCNRNGLRGTGDVYVVFMVDDNGAGFGKTIYGNTLVGITKDILKPFKEIMEGQYFGIINECYRMVVENKNREVSNEFIKSIENMNFSGDEYSIDRFSLIKNNPGYIDVLILYDDRAEDTYERYKKLWGIKDYIERREGYLEIKNTIKEYTLSLPEKYYTVFAKGSDYSKDNGGFPVLPRECCNDYYSIDTGFKRDDNDSYLIW